MTGAGNKSTTRQDAPKKGVTALTEAEFLSLILSQAGQSASTASSGSKKRVNEGEDESSRRKVQKTGDAAGESSLPTLKWVTDFAKGNEIRIEGKTLTAFDCGGQVFKAQRGKSIIELFKKFDKFLEDCNGVSAS